jgi:hypothetical protein
VVAHGFCGFLESDASKRTNTLRSVFSNLKYSVTAFEEVLKIAERLKSTIKAQIDDYNNWRKKYALLSGYDHDASLYPETVFAFELINRAAKGKDTPPDEFFGDFVIALNSTLDRCGYAKLYPANPFDWLILKCVRSDAPAWRMYDNRCCRLWRKSLPMNMGVRSVCRASGRSEWKKYLLIRY